MEGPGVARAICEASNEAHRKAVAGIILLTREMVRLRAELHERDALIREQNQHIDTLREMLFRGSP